jgi:hypothetical protein
MTCGLGGKKKEASEEAESESPLMDEHKAAKYLGVSRTTLLRMRKRDPEEGKPVVEYTRIGNKIFYTKEQLDAYIAACATTSTAEQGDGQDAVPNP